MISATTISATTVLATDEIGHRQHRPLPLPYWPQAKSISATISTSDNRPIRKARMPCEMKTDHNSNPRRLRPTDGLLKPTQATTVALNLAWLRHIPNVWGASARWRNCVALSLCQVISTKFRLQLLAQPTAFCHGTTAKWQSFRLLSLFNVNLRPRWKILRIKVYNALTC